MSLETETDGETTTFEMFGRTWSVPTRKHHRQIRAVKEILRSEGSLDADDVAAIYLSAEDYAALCDLDVTDVQLTEFATEVARAMGLGDAGNSRPSAASS